LLPRARYFHGAGKGRELPEPRPTCGNRRAALARNGPRRSDDQGSRRPRVRIREPARGSFSIRTTPDAKRPALRCSSRCGWPGPTSRSRPA